jgi:hypothetical protein
MGNKITWLERIALIFGFIGALVAILSMFIPGREKPEKTGA